MTTIKIYPSTIPGEPIETHRDAVGTLHDWLVKNCPSYKPGDDQPIAVIVAGETVAPDDWQRIRCEDADIRIIPRARGFDPFTLAIIAFVAAVAVSFLLRPNIPRAQSRGRQGQSLQEAALTANTPKPNGVIPELAGQHKIFPDYLVQPRRYFSSPTRQALDAFLSVGTGEFAITEADIRIGETAISELTNVVNYQFFEPGQNVTGNQSHRNWYNAPEVGGTVGSAGLRMTAGGSGTRFAVANSYFIDGESIVIPSGAGLAPQDWEVGNIVSIVAQIRTIEVVDGGGSIFNRNRDFVRGSFGDLNLAVGNVLLISDASGVLDGRYRVKTITSSVSIAGTASTVTGVKITPIDFLSIPVTFQINTFDVILDEDYADFDALVTAINAQVAGVVVSHAGGVITVTESSPFSGQNVFLGGFFDPVFGSAPSYFTGVATQSFDEMTLDVWATTTDEFGEETTSWQLAGGFPVGVRANVEIQKPRVKTVVVPPLNLPIDGYFPTEYRITARINGTVLDQNGNPITAIIGWDFQRLNPNGTDDAGWTGFPITADSPNVAIQLDPSAVVGGWLGPFKATPRDEATSLIEFDVFAPQGIGFVDKKGRLQARTKQWEIQWASNGGAWNSTNFAVNAASRDQLGYTNTITLPSPQSNVEVRLRRIGAEDTSLEALDRLEWYGLRTLLPAPASYAGITTMGVTITGSNAIASATENQINIIATRKLDGVPTRSIEAWVRHVCADIGYSINDIDTDELARLGIIWTARNDRFDYVFSDQSTVKESLQIALRAGYSDLTIDDGRIRPVRDEPRTTYEQLYTPQNMTSALTRQFVSYDPDDYDGVDVEYVDAVTWTTEIVECRLPGDVGIRVRKIQADGVTDRTKAWRLGMRQRRIDAYRRKTYSFSTEWDALNSRYLSYCAVADDVPGYSQSAILRAIEPVSGGYRLTVSEPLIWTGSVSHVIGLRKPDGTLSGPFLASRIDDFTATILVFPFPDGVLDFTPITAMSSVEPTHIVFGTTTRWSYPVLITDISPSGDSVDVSAVNYDVRIYADDDNNAPA